MRTTATRPAALPASPRRATTGTRWPRTPRRGLASLMWEPMSISREFGQTIAACKRDHAALNEGSPLPILNADIDHGDVTFP
ncbi:MAG: hypothetical protein R3D28_24580 [Geminicoccaceae bacterium]